MAALWLILGTWESDLRLLIFETGCPICDTFQELNDVKFFWYYQGLSDHLWWRSITHHASRSTPVLTRGRLWPPYCGSIVKLTSHWLPRAVPGWLDGPMPERSGTEMGVIVAVSRGGRRVRDRVRECVRVWFGRS